MTTTALLTMIAAWLMFSAMLVVALIPLHLAISEWSFRPSIRSIALGVTLIVAPIVLVFGIFGAATIIGGASGLIFVVGLLALVARGLRR